MPHCSGKLARNCARAAICMLAAFPAQASPEAHNLALGDAGSIGQPGACPNNLLTRRVAHMCHRVRGCIGVHGCTSATACRPACPHAGLMAARSHGWLPPGSISPTCSLLSHSCQLTNLVARHVEGLHGSRDRVCSRRGSRYGSVAMQRRQRQEALLLVYIHSAPHPNCPIIRSSPSAHQWCKCRMWRGWGSCYAASVRPGSSAPARRRRG